MLTSCIFQKNVNGKTSIIKLGYFKVPIVPNTVFLKLMFALRFDLKVFQIVILSTQCSEICLE